MNTSVSELKAVSYGIVAEHKVRDDAFFDADHITDNSKVGENDRISYSDDGRYVEIIPMEWLPTADAEVSIEKTTYQIKGTDKNGSEYSVLVESSLCLPARWLPFGSNRVTTPDVRVGERVMIWQFAGTDRYYWTTLGLDDTTRKLETVVWAISGTTDETDTELHVDNTYYFSMSTQDKNITLNTSAVNGEPYRYTFKIDTDLGNVQLSDTDGNFFRFDTAATSIRFENTRGTYVDLDIKNLVWKATDSITGVSVGKTTHTSGDLMKLIMPKAEFGDGGLEPAVLGDKLSAFLSALIDKLDNHQHIGNLGATTSPAMAVAPFDLSSHWTQTSGSIFSKKFTHF